MRPTRALRQEESIKPPSKASKVSHLLELLRPERSPHTFLSGTLIYGRREFLPPVLRLLLTVFMGCAD